MMSRRPSGSGVRRAVGNRDTASSINISIAGKTPRASEPEDDLQERLFATISQRDGRGSGSQGVSGRKQSAEWASKMGSLGMYLHNGVHWSALDLTNHGAERRQIDN